MRLRSMEMVLPNAADAAVFMTDVWGVADAGAVTTTRYVRGSGAFPYLVAFEEGAEAFVRSTTFVCTAEELDVLRARVRRAGLHAARTVSNDPGGGSGIVVEMPEGEVLRFLAGATESEPISGPDLPNKLTHVVFNAVDAEKSAQAAEAALGFGVSDRTKGMVFVRCNASHHSTAFARAGFSSLNHIAFEMRDLDAVMRGIGRLRDHRLTPSWGPGRHGPGDNAFAYFIAPFGAVVEFSTPVNTVADDHKPGEPSDWSWPEGRIDQWGVSDKDVAALRAAEQVFRFRREWSPESI